MARSNSFADEISSKIASVEKEMLKSRIKEAVKSGVKDYFRSNFQEVQIERLNEVIHRYNLLNDLLHSRNIKNSLARAGRELTRLGKERLKARMLSGRKGVTGNLLRSFKHTIKRNKLGLLAGFRGGKEGGSHSWLVSEGTSDRQTRKGYNRGRVRPNRFWSDTREQDTPRLMSDIINTIRYEVERLRERKYASMRYYRY